MLDTLPSPISLLSKVKPAALRSISLVPFPVQRFVTGKVLNQLLDESIADGDLDLLENRVLALAFTETGQTWNFSLIDHKLQLVKPRQKADVCISGSFEAFLLISNHLEDPDTLFFQRELHIEGDTELGLTIKNCLHNVDTTALPTPIAKLLELAGNIAQRIYQGDR
ncbi:MAG: hypothetical protein HOC23_19785 [Halieaceae bacterium]|jgi:O2-independent ubiquinone biosynthesis accessory factor UbiT|nr:hypothetical protein [Halieaceae bacterium]